MRHLLRVVPGSVGLPPDRVYVFEADIPTAVPDADAAELLVQFRSDLIDVTDVVDAQGVMVADAVDMVVLFPDLLA